VRVLARLRGFQRLTRVGDALRMVSDSVRIVPPKIVSVPLEFCLGKVLGECVVAPKDLPSVDRSVVDGFAVRAEDMVGSTQSEPKVLKLKGGNLVGGGEAVRVWTGQPIPKGANSVVMLENAKLDGNSVRFFGVIVPHENVSRKGEDVAKGVVAMRAGLRLRSHHVGLLAAMGFAKVKVFGKPKVAVLATGNEIVEVGSSRGRGQIFDVNRHVLLALCEELGVETVDLGIVGDDVGKISDAIKHGVDCADIVVSSGGTSVGSPDLVPEAVKLLPKSTLIVHGVALRPAMPTGVAVVGGKPVLLLSGNPVASVIGFEVFGRPLLCKMLGLKEVEARPVVRARLLKRVTVALGRMNYVRVKVQRIGNDFVAEPVSSRGSGLISTLTRANGFLVVGEDREGVAEGEIISVSLFDDVRGD
jgi:molybdopterin molybdotransferase